MADRLVKPKRLIRRPHLSAPRTHGRRRLSRRSLGLLIAFAVALVANVAVVVMHGGIPSARGSELQQQRLPVMRLAGRALVPELSLRSGFRDLMASAPTATAALEEAVAPAAAALTAIAPAPSLEPPAVALAMAADPTRYLTWQLRPRETLAGSLQGHGVAGQVVQHIIDALTGKLDFKRVIPGDVLTLHFDDAGAVARFEYLARSRSGPGERFRVTPAGEGMAAEQVEVEVERKTTLVSGVVRSTLYDSMLATGEGISLIRMFTEVFGWEIDFYREVQDGDQFRALIEKRYAEDRFLGYGRLLAAEYAGRGGTYRAYFYEDGHTSGYFNADGESMQKTFLKSPVEVTQITSSFGMRFHPIMKRHRQHNGVDYGAPTGTPIWTVADGVVTARGFNSGIGNHVSVRHPNGYETVYGHMSRFADIKVGDKVRQRQVVGYCGSTGLSTGPHVHYGMKHGGAYVNPMTQKFPRGKPLPEASREGFARAIQALANQLDKVEIALAGQQQAGQG